MKFTQPVSMQCSQKQFERDLKERLEKLGYATLDKLFHFKKCPIIATNYIRQNIFSNTSWNFERAYNRYFIDHYNPQLFLALASMTDEPNGILGEYYTNIRRDKFTKKTSETQNSLIQDKIWLKATKEELITLLTKKAREYSSPIIKELLEDKTTSEVRKTWEYENGVPVNFKVTSLDKEYLFIHPQEYERILNELEVKILELEQKIILQKNIINEASKLVNDAISKIK